MAQDRERESKVSLLARRGFVDPAGAAARLASPAFGELGRDPLVEEALGRCADPDLALDALARVLEASAEPETLRATLASSKPLRDRLLGVLGVSAALGDFLVRHPDAWHELEEFEVEDLAPGAGRFSGQMLGAVGAVPDVSTSPREGTQAGGSAAIEDLERDLGVEPGIETDGAVPAPVAPPLAWTDPPVATLTGAAAADALRVAYRRALLAVTARDVAAGSEMSTVAADLADLAGATLEAALAVARAEEPADAAPCRLAVIGMGKCGARELNYLSDVDVVFVAEPVPPAPTENTGNGHVEAARGWDTEDDETAALRTATRLASRMMRLCSESTPEGSIWQVDAALRPEGKAGPLVRTLASHTAYYQRWAKTWEFQALLKARPVAGDTALGAAYIAMTAPLVWSAVARDHFVNDVQAMRRRVVSHATDSLRRAPGAVAVDRELKLGPGGLRDVEFAVQLLQLVHGRADETLRVRSTLDALDALAMGGYVGREDAAHLAAAYKFLRTVEHRIQLFRLERTHTMPEDPAALRRIGRSMGWTGDPAGELRAAWRSHAREVRRLHEKLFYRPLLSAVARLDETSAAVPSAVGPRPRLSAEAARSRLAALGYANPAGALVNIEALATGLSRRAAIQRTLLPVMLDWFADAPDPDAGLLAFRRVSDALGETPWYLRSLRDEGEAAWRLARVLSSGGYAPDLLMRAPEAVALLNDDTALAVRDRAVIEAEMTALVYRADSAENAVAAVRAVRRRELFRIVAADILGLLTEERGGDPLDVLGRALTDVAAATVESALAAVIAFRKRAQAGATGGAPDAARGEGGGGATQDAESEWSGARLPTRLAVIAMGRFGGGELGYGSDVDVMFVHEPREGADEQQATAVAFEIANELRRLLQLPSADPPLEIDADLRPEGRQGPLVRSLASYAEYYKRWSRVWESQALLRAVPIAGDALVGERFVRLIDPLRYPQGGVAEADLREIRRIKARMEAERLPRGADRSLHTKLGPGGLSDVEWVAQLIQLQHAATRPDLRTTATRAVLRAAVEADLLSADDMLLLDDAWYETTRVRNGITVVRSRPADQLPTGARDLAGIARYLSDWDELVQPADVVGQSGSTHGASVHKASGHGVSGQGSSSHGTAAQTWTARVAPRSGAVAQATEPRVTDRRSGTLDDRLFDHQRVDGEALLDAHRRRTRRARAVFERLFYG